MTIRVLIVDDHAVVRAGLRLLLDAEEDLETVGEAGDAREAVFEVRSSKPNVVIMDVGLGGGKNGIEATADVLHEAPEAKVLMLSMRVRPQGGGGQRARRGRAGCCDRCAVRRPSARRTHRSRGCRSCPFCGRGSPLRSRARGPSAPCPRPHEPGDREGAFHLRAHGGDASGAHHAEATDQYAR
jgi:chemotaxis response regulator CheB